MPLTKLLVAGEGLQNELYTTARVRTTTYYDLGCKHQGLGGYFAPDRWYKTTDFGDGGVDVTEAPNAKVVEGATGARLLVQTAGSDRYTWCITVPADGYMYFRLRKVGSFLSQRISSTNIGFQLFRNEEPLTYRPISDGGYYSPHLRAGDRFSIHFEGKGEEFEWADFIFYSNCVGVIVLEPSQEELDSGRFRADRVQPIRRAELEQIYFPFDEPEVWPVVDEDGDLITIDDQYELGSDQIGDNSVTEQAFGVEVQDRLDMHAGQFWLMRRFVFTEPCSGNVMSADRPWLPLPLLPPHVGVDIRR